MARRFTWLTADFEYEATFSKKLSYCKTLEFLTAVNNVTGCRDATSVSTWCSASFFRSSVLLMDAVSFSEKKVPVNQFTCKPNGGEGSSSGCEVLCVCVRACLLAVCYFNSEVVMELLLTRLFDWRFLTL